MLHKSFISVIIIFFVLIIDNSAWRSPMPCPNLKINFGRIRYRQKGRFVKFQCNPGYILAGEKYSTCIRGEWDTPPPKCVRATCPKIKPPINGLIYPSHRGAVLNFFCKPEYELRGPNITYCEGRHWSNNLPSCVRTNTKPPLSCDFETDDLCGWTQDLRHDFDWIRINSSTPSGYLGTGPSYDHTKGENGKGFYMYIESSSRNENDTARLISPIYDKIDTKACFKFFYHMYGSTMGSLRIYLKKIGHDWSFKPTEALFTESGNHGDRWIEGFIKLGPIDEDFQIIIEGVNGPSYISDLAVDDVQLIENCTEEFETTLTTEFYVTEPVLPYESCANRCENDNITSIGDSFQISCNCSESCIEDNSCCPDFISLCIVDAADDSTTLSSTLSSTTKLLTTKNYTNNTDLGIIKTKSTKFESSSQKSVVINEIDDKKVSTTEGLKPIINNVSQNIENSVEYSTEHSLSISTFADKKISMTSIKQTSQMPTSIPVSKKLTVNIPTLKFLTPPPTQPIVQILPKTIKTDLFTIEVITKTYQITTPSTVTPKPPKTVSQIPRIIDEILTLPPNKDDAPFKQEVITERAESTTNKLLTDSNAKNAKIVIVNSKINQSNFSVILISSGVVVVLMVICVILLIRRYSVTGCRRLKKFNSTGDSQSDVRFLTSDEQLDFTLARPDNYNSL